MTDEFKTAAWIAFSGNGNIRFWTDDAARAKDERARGRDLRPFTLAELVTLAALRAQETNIGFADIEREIVEYISLAGFEVIENGGGWIAHLDEVEIDCSALATAIFRKVSAGRPSEPGEVCP